MFLYNSCYCSSASIIPVTDNASLTISVTAPVTAPIAVPDAVPVASQTDFRTGKPRVWLSRDRDTNQPRGDATVGFEDPQMAAKAIQMFNSKWAALMPTAGQWRLGKCPQ